LFSLFFLCCRRLLGARVYGVGILLFVHPKMAFSCASVASPFAARVAASLQRPCADLVMPALRQASEKALPKLSLVKG
jgi:hypothetical protein